MNKKYKDGKKNISHNPEVAGSNPVPATTSKTRNLRIPGLFLRFLGSFTGISADGGGYPLFL
jgi:hypothetical protein